MAPGEPDLGAELAPHQRLLASLHITPKAEAKPEIWHPVAPDDEIGITTDNADEGVW